MKYLPYTQNGYDCFVEFFKIWYCDVKNSRENWDNEYLSGYFDYNLEEYVSRFWYIVSRYRLVQ